MKWINNKSRIAAYIWNCGGTSKMEIARELNLSMPTVLQAVNELLEAGIAVEAGAYESTGGRKAKSIALNPSQRYAAGIDITANHLSYVLIDFRSRIERQERIRRAYENSLTYYEGLNDKLEQFIGEAGVDKKLVLGVGISLPGILNREHTELVRSHILGVEHVRLSNINQSIGYPVKFENDANSALIAEMEGGKGNVLYLSLSNSVGGALYLNGKLYTGDSSRAGEFGHMIIKKGGRPCYCGKRGCADAYLAAHQLAALAGDNLETFFRELEQGNPKCTAAWEKYLENLSVAVTNLRMIADCQIVLGGYVGAYMDPYMQNLNRKVLNYSIFEQETSYLKPCRCRQEASAVGIAMEFIKDYIHTL